MLRFGLAPATWDVGIEGKLTEFCRALAGAIGMPVAPFAATDYRGIVDALIEGRVDVAWLPPVIALRGVAEGSLLPLALPVRGGVSAFSAVLIARQGSRFHTVSDVHDARMGWVDRQSASGYLVIRSELRAAGIDLRTAFTLEEFCGTHPRVVHAVASGRVDLGATYACFADDGSVLAASWLDAGLAPSIRVIGASSPIPADVVAMSLRTPVLEGRLVQRALLGARPGTPLGDAAAQLFHAEGFDVPPPEHLRPLARVLDELDAARRFHSVPPGRQGG